MKTNLFLIISLLLLLSGCKTQQTVRQTEENPTVKQIEENPLNQFVTGYLGLKKGDTIEKVYELYGEPTKSRINDDKYSYNSIYYYWLDDKRAIDYSALAFSYEKDTHKISVIYVEHSAAELLKSKNIEETLYLDMYADDLRKLFGEKKFGVANNLRYEEDDFDVEFFCYEFNDYKCYRYNIFWWN